MLGIKLPDLRGVQKAEIWGIVVIACFNLALLAVAIRYGGLGQGWILALVALAQLCTLMVINLLLKVRLGRDEIDDLHKIGETLLGHHKELTSQVKSMEGIMKAQAKLLEKELKDLKELFHASATSSE